MQNVQNVRKTERLSILNLEKLVGVTEARTRFSELVDEVRYQGDAVVLIKSGKPAAVMVSVNLYEKWQAERAKRFEVFDKVQGQNKAVQRSEDELTNMLETAKHEIRESKNTTE